MIFKCASCEHVFEQAESAYGWEKDHYLEACPNCKISLQSPTTEIKLINGLALLQFLAALWVGSALLFSQQDSAVFFTWILIAAALGMFFRNDKKGLPVVCKPQKQP